MIPALALLSRRILLLQPSTSTAAFTYACALIVASMNAKYGGEKITCTQLDSVEEVLKASDIVSLHTVLDETTTGMIDKAALEMMKPDAVLVNSSRGPIINETDLVAHLQANPDFRCGAEHITMHPSGSKTTALLCTKLHGHACLTRWMVHTLIVLRVC